MSKFEYNRGSRVTEKRAKKAQRIIWTLKASLWLVPIAAAVILILASPLEVWAPILSIVGFCTLIGIILVKGDAVIEWYKDLRRDLDYAKMVGVTDE